MNKAIRVMVILLLAGAAASVLTLKPKREASGTAPVASAAPVAAITEEAVSGMPDRQAVTNALPRLVDLGAGKCIPCKMMAPILEELKQECAGIFDVAFIDVWENPEAGAPYGIRMIPTQIFYDREGRELFRHEGFFGKADILAKWQEHGVTAPPTSLE